MTSTDKINNSDILNQVVIEGMKNLKANDIVSLNLNKIETSVCDYFIICHGTSNTHVNAITVELALMTLIGTALVQTKGCKRIAFPSIIT
jgi:ribosomal silencing factor RsfS